MNRNKKNIAIFMNKAVLYASVLFSLFFLVIGQVYLFTYSFGVVVLLLACMAFHSLNYTRTAQITFIMTVALALAFFTFLLGKEAAIYQLFIVIGILPLLSFDNHQVKLRRVAFGIVYSTYLSMEAILFFTSPYMKISSISLKMISIFSMFCVISIGFAVIQYFLNQMNQYQHHLVNLNKELETSNHRLMNTNRQLKESRDAQVQLTQHAQYAKLVQGIAHEIKNPLQMVQGTAELALMPGQNAKESLNIILDNIDRLNHVIQPLLLYLKEYPHGYSFKMNNIIDLIHDIQQLCKANCRSKKIKVDINYDRLSKPELVFDQNSLGQVLINLITNSIDAIDHDHGQIKITVSNDRMIVKGAEAEALKITISDNGCGIEPDALKTIFLPYQSAHKHAENFGLGLSIVAKIVNDHQGLINVESIQNKGTDVYIFIPLGIPNTTPMSYSLNTGPAFELDGSFFEDSE